MTLLAESGATKTHWVYINEKRAVLDEWETAGMNLVSDTPAHITSTLETIHQCIENPQEVTQLLFFGAGCTGTERMIQFEKTLQNYFTQASIHLASDILAAAKACCGQEAGIVCILGTGANASYFDGQSLRQAVPALGYILGDEGSGSDLGKTLLRAYFYKQLPKTIEKQLEEEYDIQKETAFKQVYHGANPKKYLAHFAPFLAKHQEDPFIKQLIATRFHLFIENQILPYEEKQNSPVHFVGSIAYYFEQPLSDCLKQHQLIKGKIIRQPIYEMIKNDPLQLT